MTVAVLLAIGLPVHCASASTNHAYVANMNFPRGEESYQIRAHERAAYLRRVEAT